MGNEQRGIVKEVTSVFGSVRCLLYRCTAALYSSGIAQLTSRPHTAAAYLLLISTVWTSSLRALKSSQP